MVPGYAQARDAIENATLARTLEPSRFTGTARIPVVVHVVSTTAEQDISDEQIASQIEVLNRDFRATNPDTSTVPPVFAGSSPTRRSSSSSPPRTPTATRPRDHPDLDERAVVREQRRRQVGGDRRSRRLARRSVPQHVGVPAERRPAGLRPVPRRPARDRRGRHHHHGLRHAGDGTAPFDLGRTATHEVGHYLNLFHIWGDDGTGCRGSDLVDDTPNQGSENTGRPRFPHISCGNGPNGDLFMNYMDYVDDAVMVMFTHGQAARMAACLDEVRPSLLVSPVATVEEPVGRRPAHRRLVGRRPDRPVRPRR